VGGGGKEVLERGRKSALTKGNRFPKILLLGKERWRRKKGGAERTKCEVLQHLLFLTGEKEILSFEKTKDRPDKKMKKLWKKSAMRNEVVWEGKKRRSKEVNPQLEKRKLKTQQNEERDA